MSPRLPALRGPSLSALAAIRPPATPPRRPLPTRRSFSITPSGLASRDDCPRHDPEDGRLQDALAPRHATTYSTLRARYSSPVHPIVLAHGLLGFVELRLLGKLPAIEYWRGIKDALAANAAANVADKPPTPQSSSSPPPPPPVIACTVPPAGSIATRAEHLSRDIVRQLRPPGSAGQPPTPINIIAHSMGGLDARYLASVLRPAELRVLSLTTIATPHRGSRIADLFLEGGGADGPEDGPRLRSLIDISLRRAGLDGSTAALAQLSRPYLARVFNPGVPDDPLTRYFSFGASITGPGDEDAAAAAAAPPPPLLSPFRIPWRLLNTAEGPNDGLVSVASARWGDYRGTLVGVSHLDLINWTNRVGWTVKAWMGVKKNFNAVALYLDIADMLAKEGL